jgi:hypothetical protein
MMCTVDERSDKDSEKYRMSTVMLAVMMTVKQLHYHYTEQAAI